jgi:hypothetical protein
MAIVILFIERSNFMSGGHFDYAQYRIEDIAKEIDELIANNDNPKLDSFNFTIGNFYPDNIIEKFNETRRTLRLAAAMTQRVDYLVSGDDGKDSFLRRWAEEVDILR